MCLCISPNQSSDQFDTFCSNPNLFLSNINDLNSASLIVTSDFNAGTSKWWLSDKETFEARAIHSLTDFGWVHPAYRSTYSCN